MIEMSADTHSIESENNFAISQLESLANTDYVHDDSDTDLCASLIGLMQSIAATGRTKVEWRLLKPLIVKGLRRAFKQFPEGDDSSNVYVSDPTNPVLIDGAPINEFLERIIATTCQFNSAPWTIQRIFELLLNPRLYWSTKDKFIYAFSKVIFGIKSDENRFRFGSWTGNVEGELTFQRWPDTPVDEVALMDQRIRDAMDTSDIETIAAPSLAHPAFAATVRQGEMMAPNENRSNDVSQSDGSDRDMKS